ncbi:MAG: hypothetical protein H6Q90_3147 [Deltaproteobacteria bacterium]|nr:hypothetical protein [Deltaproteobacteria bacterium]
MACRVRHLGLVLWLVATVVACKKGDKVDKAADEPIPAVATTPPAGATATPPAAQPDPAASDASEPRFGKPGLSEDKIQRYIKSLAAGKNVFAAAAVGANGSLASVKVAMDEQEAFVKQYGFSGTSEYMDLMGRIALGQAELMAAEGAAKVREAMSKTIEETEKSLADPKLPAETKASLTEMVNESKKQLAELDAEVKKSELAPADLALVKKFHVEIETAEKANFEAQKKPKK